MTHAWMHNPETGGYWKCPVDYKPTAEVRGWVECDEPPPDDSHLRDAPQDSPATEPVEKPTIPKAAKKSAAKKSAKEQ